jgi:hypothetical protein
VVKKVRFFKKSDSNAIGYVIIRAGAKGGRETGYIRTVAVLKALGVEKWSKEERRIRLTGSALGALMRLEPVCAALGQCRKT